jgi:uncharacterized protein
MRMTQGDVHPELRRRLAERYRIIDGQTLRALTEAALAWLRTNQQVVNALNVFPVPDGDTGTNMTLTMQSAWQEIEAMGERPIGAVAKLIAHGALMGARGNSGVILSQLWRGFARALDDVPVMDARLLVQALSEARVTAYKGVVQPVEGTILTVSKDIAAAAEAALNNGAISTLDILEAVVNAADASVQRTPELLPVLKEAGVVDSGGKGLFFILEGMLRSTYGMPLDQPAAVLQPLSAIKLQDAAGAIEPGQDWEVVIDFRPNQQLDLTDFYQGLEKLGTSIQVGEGDGIYRMHIHVPDTTEYQPIDYIRGLGTVTRVAIENLMDQMDEHGAPAGAHTLRLTSVEPGQIAVVAVAPGAPLARIFASLGAAAIVMGGQTMNPSTQEILGAFEDLPTEQVIILPNNKNIHLAAQQAAELTVKQVRVVPSLSVPQGIAAMLALDADGDLETITQAMHASLDSVHTIELTRATRSVEIDGVEVREGQFICLLNGKLALAGEDLPDVLLGSLAAADADQAELVTLYHGADLGARQANQIADQIRQAFPKQEVELVDGGQPHYQLIVSIE